MSELQPGDKTPDGRPVTKTEAELRAKYALPDGATELVEWEEYGTCQHRMPFASVTKYAKVRALEGW